MSKPTVTFREVVDRIKADEQRTMLDVLCLVRVQAGVSFQASRAAYMGTRVQPETARDLAAWALQTRGATLDTMALIEAPTRAKRGTREPEPV